MQCPAGQKERGPPSKPLGEAPRATSALQGKLLSRGVVPRAYGKRSSTFPCLTPRRFGERVFHGLRGSLCACVTSVSRCFPWVSPPGGGNPRGGLELCKWERRVSPDPVGEGLRGRRWGGGQLKASGGWLREGRLGWVPPSGGGRRPGGVAVSPVAAGRGPELWILVEPSVS